MGSTLWWPCRSAARRADRAGHRRQTPTAPRAALANAPSGLTTFFRNRSSPSARAAARDPAKGRITAQSPISPRRRKRRIEGRCPPREASSRAFRRAVPNPPPLVPFAEPPIVRLSPCPNELAAAVFVKSISARLGGPHRRHVAEGHYPGCQSRWRATASSCWTAASGDVPHRAAAQAGQRRPRCCCTSNTKVVTAAALWVLAERGPSALPTASPIPFRVRANGKPNVTSCIHDSTMAASPFVFPRARWTTWQTARRRLQLLARMTPGSKLSLPPRAAHWVAGGPDRGA